MASTSGLMHPAPQPRPRISAPKIRLLDGEQMPCFALGSHPGYYKNTPMLTIHSRTRTVVEHAIDIGYRHFDTSPVYGTEEAIGEAIFKKIEEGKVIRRDLYITSKLWNTYHKREQVLVCLQQSLNRINLNYIDLFLMHWPMGHNDDYSYSDVDYMETWRGMEKVMRFGLVRSIGLSNFNRQQLQRVLAEGTFKPVVLQIEVHPQIIQTELIELCKSEAIVVMGYSPLGSLVPRFGLNMPGPSMNDAVLVFLAQEYGKTPVQILLRWAIDRGVVPIQNTFNLDHLAENINIFDFELSNCAIRLINLFNSNTRYTLPSFWQEHPYYPFEKVDNPLLDPNSS